MTATIRHLTVALEMWTCVAREAIRFICILPLLFYVACSNTSHFEGQARHVVLISIDTARADFFGFMGNDRVRTPNLDALAQESIVMTDCMTVVPTTLASHTSLFTGLYPHHHGTPRNGFMVHSENVLLPEILREAGFHTVGFVGSFVLNSQFDFPQGFDYYDEDFGSGVVPGDTIRNERPAAAVTDAVIRYLDTIDLSDRLFLFVHYYDPHLPYTSPAPFDRMYDPMGRDQLPAVYELMKSSSLTRAQKVALAGRHELQYAAEVSYTDHHIGRLLDKLRQRGILDEAVLVLTSDHGETFMEHYEVFNHGQAVYQTTMHTICMIRLPGGEWGGSRYESPVSNIDILPTLLDRVGVDIPDDIDGEPIRFDAEGEPPSQRILFGEASKPREEVETDPKWVNTRKSRCARLGRYKYIWTPFRGTEELYDLISDPTEKANLLVTPSPDIERMAEHLKGALGSWSASADPRPSRFNPSHTEEVVERLKSLGYLK